MSKRDIEKAREIIDELAEEQGAVIIVEGKRDKEALVSLGIESGRIMTLSGSIQETSEKAARKSKKAIVLTDYDRTGRAIAGKLKRCLVSEGVNPNFEFRRKLRKHLMFTFVEEIPSLLLKG